jgi:hypothetical protein
MYSIATLFQRIMHPDYSDYTGWGKACELRVVGKNRLQRNLC